jgi:hypothetical protein
MSVEEGQLTVISVVRHQSITVFKIKEEAELTLENAVGHRQ